MGFRLISLVVNRGLLKSFDRFLKGVRILLKYTPPGPLHATLCNTRHPEGIATYVCSALYLRWKCGVKWVLVVKGGVNTITLKSYSPKP